MKIISGWIDTILANPGRFLGIVAACILAVLETLVGKGILTADTVTTITNIGAILAVIITGFVPATRDRS